MTTPCFCYSGQNYEECCQVFHKGSLPETALQLMRSRYSAYAMNNADYIIATTHPANPQYSDNLFNWKRGILKRFSNDTIFKQLDIHDFQEKGTMATVTFTAHIHQGDHDDTFTEKSIFQKIKNKWYYLSGKLEHGNVPEMFPKEPFSSLPLAYYGNPVLRKKAEPIEAITEDVKKLVEDMIATMDVHGGMGLAAPQVNQSLRLFVIRQPIGTDRENLTFGAIKVFINPRIVPKKEIWKATEGCLSIPAVRMSVDRPKEITVEYTDLDGLLVEEHVSGWEAKVILHEFDHIEGVLFIDHLNKSDKDLLAPFLISLEKRMKKIH